jgi:hypothetical protein
MQKILFEQKVMICPVPNGKIVRTNFYVNTGKSSLALPERYFFSDVTEILSIAYSLHEELENS